MKKIAIIGAGMAGLSAAHLLKKEARVVVFDKSRGVGGRMSTRRAQPYSFDHGAQYFTAREDAFKRFIQPLVEEGVIQPWAARHVKLDGDQVIQQRSWEKEEPRYVGVPGMTAIAKYLAQDLPIHLNTKITSLKQSSKWCLIDENNQENSGFDWVISTLPAPQALLLLPETFQGYAAIKDTHMQPCIALMLGFSHSLPLSFEAAHVTNKKVSWIAVNSHKPNRGKDYTLLVHSSAKYAQQNSEKDPNSIIDDLIAEASYITGHDLSAADYKAIHQWRYATNTVWENSSNLYIDPILQLAACGDWCQGGRVEGAFMSAYHLSEALKEHYL